MFVLTAPATAERRAYRRTFLTSGGARFMAETLGLDNYLIVSA